MADFCIIDGEGRSIARLACSRRDAEAAARRKGGTVFEGIVLPGHVVVDGEAVPGPDAAPTDALRAELKADIDFEAGQVRGLFITTVAGQELVYAEKRAEAARVVSGDESDVPHLAAEAATNGNTLAAQAAIVLAMADAWRTVSVMIETRRLEAKAAVDAAATESEARAAAVVDWSDIRALAS